MTQDHLADAEGEDKLSKRGARARHGSVHAVAAHFERAFVEDAIRARARRTSSESSGDDAALHPRATRHVAEMLVLIQRLTSSLRDFAYVDRSGQVYFSVAKFPEYGKLSGKVIDELARARA